MTADDDAAVLRPPEATGRCRAVLVVAFGLCAPVGLPAQDAGHLEHPAGAFERLLARGEFEVQESRTLRDQEPPTLQVTLRFADGREASAKLTPAPAGGGTFNNRPRYEVAAYELQKLFLEEGSYVVPPTVCRCLPPPTARVLLGEAEPTFGEIPCRLVLMQAWLWGVTDEEVFDRSRLRSDTTYARHLANVDVLTYLVEHKDANRGNVLLAREFLSSRVFAVDNGVSFESVPGDRGTEWRRLRVDRIPRRTVERLRDVRLADLRERLGTLAQFERRPRGMVRVEPTEPIDPEQGLRLQDGVLQIGLDRDEIRSVHERIQELLERVDEGELGTL